MVIKWFIQHQIKQSMRASIWQKTLVINIILGLVLLLMLAYLLFLGIFIDVILNEMFPDNDPIILFNSMLLYYFGLEFFIRFFMQSLPTLNLETYLHVPIKRSSIVHFVASKSIVVIGNYLSWLILIPFAVKVIVPNYSVGVALIWLLGIILLIFTNNFLATYVKRHLVGNPAIVGVFGMTSIVLVFLEQFNILSASQLSANFFGHLLEDPIFLLIPCLALVGTYSLNYFYIKSRLYPEEITHKKTQKVDRLANVRYFSRLGMTGQLLSLEMRLLWRHKRTRSMLVLAPLFWGYGLVFYPDAVEGFSLSVIMIFVGIFMTGGMMISYLSYCFSYDSNFFDVILTKYSDIRQYIRAKYILALTVSTISFLVTIPYVFISTQILFINSMIFLYNIGLLSFVLLYVSTYSRKKMDLSKGSAFNYQGFGASHWLTGLPAFFLPIVTFLPFRWAGQPETGIIVIGCLGLIGLLFHKLLLGVVIRQFKKSQYAMAEGFRQSE